MIKKTWYFSLFFVVCLFLLSCASIINIPRVTFSFWNNLKPINVSILSNGECFKSTINFQSGGYTIFNDFELMPREFCLGFNGDFKLSMSKEEFENSFQWNLNYIEERFKDCR